MKKIALILALVLVVVSSVIAGTIIVRQYFTNKANVTVAWEYDSAADPDVMGFNLYLQATGTSEWVKTDIADPAARTYVLTNFPEGQYTAFMRAYDRYGNESDDSDWVQVTKKTTKPGKVGNPVVTDANFMIVVQ